MPYDVRARYPTPVAENAMSMYVGAPIVVEGVSRTVSSEYHILLEPHCLDKIISNSKSPNIYKHYLKLKELFAVYNTYVRVFTEREATNVASDWEWLDTTNEDHDNVHVNTHLYPPVATNEAITPRPAIVWKRPHAASSQHLDTTQQLLSALPTDMSGNIAAELFAIQYLRHHHKNA